jgi:hypothetical protein
MEGRKKKSICRWQTKDEIGQAGIQESPDLGDDCDRNNDILLSFYWRKAKHCGWTHHPQGYVLRQGDSSYRR